ncbi:MAG: patatin-like phospholipase family protein [Acidobacteriota bacterium]|nr:MAG: patatin-like phospholipase family protein [Acidobacteriota bacterium]
MRRVLSIDGGGLKGVYPATLLASFEASLPEPLYKYFDLVVGTSTGGIIALAISLGIPASKIVAFYEEYGPQIFSGSALLAKIRHARRIKWNSEPLERALTETFGTKRIDDCLTRTVVVSMKTEGDVHLYKTCHRADFTRDYHRSVVEAALATSAAATYFPTLSTLSGEYLTDGGLWANNPVLVAAIEAVGLLNWPKKEVNILSLGCTEKSGKDIRSARSGLRFLFGHSVDAFMSMQSKSALSGTYTLLGHENVFRVNDPGNFALDDPRQVPALKELALIRFDMERACLMKAFFSEPVNERFVPFKRAEPLSE